MWNLIGLVFLTVTFVYVVTRISDTYKLLSGVSDDIYDIKNKLGLETELSVKKKTWREDALKMQFMMEKI